MKKILQGNGKDSLYNILSEINQRGFQSPMKNRVVMEMSLYNRISYTIFSQNKQEVTVQDSI